MIEGIIGGLIAGAAYGIVGFVKNKGEYGSFEDFNWRAFGSTVLGSAIIGGIASYSGQGIDIVAASAIGVVTMQFVKKVFSVVMRFFEDKLQSI